MRKYFYLFSSLLSIFPGAHAAKLGETDAIKLTHRHPSKISADQMLKKSTKIKKKIDFISQISNKGTPPLKPSHPIEIVIKKPIHRMSPVVSKEGEAYKVNPQFVSGVQTYADMADLSYHLVKGRNELSTEGLEKFMSQGWKITAFGGFSGNAKFDKSQYDAKNRDLAGFVASHSKTGEAVVVFHGSQDSYDWENNFDAQMVGAKDMGFKFEGKVARGFASRYMSAKSSIYGILNNAYAGLDEAAKNNFHITVTGHSLGGGITTLGYADISTDYAKALWGSEYINAEHNRIRGYAMSPPRAIDQVAVDHLSKDAGVHNIIIDTNDLDPVSIIGGPGKSFTKWLKSSSDVGPTRWLLATLRAFGITEESNPHKAAELYGGGKHFGFKALQDTNETIAKAHSLPEDPKIMEEINKKGFFARTYAKAKRYVETKLAPYHYGKLQAHGAAFEPRLIQPETLEARINKAYTPPPDPLPKKP